MDYEQVEMSQRRLEQQKKSAIQLKSPRLINPNAETVRRLQTNILIELLKHNPTRSIQMSRETGNP